jgi:phosphatidate cytidylyltransferase
VIKRTITGVVAAVSTTALVLFAPFEAMVVVALVCAGVASFEFDRLFFPSPSSFRLFRTLFHSFFGVLGVWILGDALSTLLWIPFTMLSLSCLFAANRSTDFERLVRELSLELLGTAYVLCMVAFLLPIGAIPDHGREFLLLLFFIVFAGDTFAFFVGSLFGKHRLAERISPKKSLEGALGGMLGAVLFSLIWYRAIYSGPHTFTALTLILFLALSVSLLAQLGDLFESVLKRSRAQKDSGTFLPGHGGILDRLDGLALSAPAFYFFVVYIWGLYL